MLCAGDTMGRARGGDVGVDLERDPLGLTSEQIRQLGYRTVDLLADQLTDSSIPAMRRGDPAELRARLARPPPDGPRD
jgi:hypothetical protein